MSRCSGATAAGSPIAAALERMPARCGGARRHPVSDRPRRDGQGARLRPADGQFSRRRLGPRFRVEFLAAASLAGVHLSRLAEEIVIWCIDAVPLHRALRRLHHRQLDHAAKAQSRRRRTDARQDRPDRRRACRACTMMKGLPLTYGKDMQEDKEPLFDAADLLELCVAAMTGMVRDLRPNPERMRAVAAPGFGGDRPRRLAGAHGRLAVPPGPSRDRRGRLRAEPRRTSTGSRSPRCGRSSRHHPGRLSRAHGRASVAARKSFGGTAPRCRARGQATPSARQVSRHETVPYTERRR